MAERRALLEAQAALLASLVDGAPVPPGFDVEAVQALSSSLAHKRARAAAQVWPKLAACLGAQLSTLFAEHVATGPLLRRHGPLADGWTLSEVCEARGLLDGAAALELGRVRLQFQRVADGVERRTGLLRVARARGATQHVWLLFFAGRVVERTIAARAGRQPALSR